MLVTADCGILTNVGSKLAPSTKAAFIAAYKQGTQTLASGGWLTTAQAATLGTLAGGL